MLNARKLTALLVAGACALGATACGEEEPSGGGGNGAATMPGDEAATKLAVQVDQIGEAEGLTFETACEDISGSGTCTVTNEADGSVDIGVKLDDAGDLVLDTEEDFQTNMTALVNESNGQG